MKKITVITLQNVRNYGSVLQAFATQKIFEQIGCQVDFFNYVRPNFASKRSRIIDWTKGMGKIKKIIYIILLYPTFMLQDKRFKKFISLYLNVQSEKCTTLQDFQTLNLTSDIYCTGSDQTWNSNWNGGFLPELFLNFIPDHIKKIAYSASFGKSKLDEWEKDETRRSLRRYHVISVRESNAVDIINDLGIDGAVHVLDPTLQLNRNFWKQYAGDHPFKGRNYMLIYQLNTNSQFDRYAKEFAHRKGLKLVRFCTRIDQIIKCGKSIVVPEVLDFVRYIYHADFVITDSFHATAFSINVNTQFISIYPNDFSTRLNSILQLVGLEKRHLSSYEDFSFVNAAPIDFAHANNVLEVERKRCLHFINSAIQ